MLGKFILGTTIAIIVSGTVEAAGNYYDSQAVTLHQNSDIEPDGSYHYNYETSNGITAGESGVGGYYANGEYSYYSPEGYLIKTSYKADENGFQPVGDHLPTPPPIPHYILRSLEYIRTHPKYEDNNDSHYYNRQTQYRQHNRFDRRHF